MARAVAEQTADRHDGRSCSNRWPQQTRSSFSSMLHGLPAGDAANFTLARPPLGDAMQGGLSTAGGGSRKPKSKYDAHLDRQGQGQGQRSSEQQENVDPATQGTWNQAVATNACAVAAGSPHHLSRKARIDTASTAASLPLHPRSLFTQQLPPQLPPIPPATVAHYTPSGLGSLDDGEDEENAPTPPAADDTGMRAEEGKEDESADLVDTSLVTASFVSAGAAPTPSTSLSFLRSGASPIRLNVGGLIFQTTFQTLCFEPHTYFAARFGGRFEEQASPYDGSFFIDRDGTHFRHILNWMRDNVLSVGHGDIDTLMQIKLEAEFYTMPKLVKETEHKISEARIELMARKMDAASSSAASAAASAAPSKNPHLPSAGPGSASRTPLHPAPPAAHRNLFVTNWGVGGMGGAGATSFVHASSAVRSYSSAAGSMAASSAAATASQHQPSYTAAQPHLPTRTHSCPSAMYATDGNHTSSAVPASSQRPTPLHIHHHSSSSNSSFDAQMPHSMQSQMQSQTYMHPAATVDQDDRSMESEVEEPFTTDADF